MKTFDFAKVRGELDNGEYFGHIVNTPWHEDARYDKFSDAEFQRRWAATRELMARHGLDCLVVPGSTSAMSMGQGLIWLTGHLDARASAHYVVFPREGEPTLIVSMGGSHIECVRRAVSVQDVRPAPGSQFGRAIAERISELGYASGKIGLMNVLSESFGAEYLPANHYLTLKERLPQAQLEFVPDFFHEL